MTERVPANDLDAEGAVLGAILLEPHRFDQCSWLEKKHFYADANARVFEAFLGLREEAKAVDLVSIATWLRDCGRLAEIGGTPYLAELTAQPFIVRIEEHARTIFNKWRIRQIGAVGLEASAGSYAPIEDAQEYIADVERKVAELLHIGQARKLEHAYPIARQQIQDLVHARERGDALLGLSTGFTDLDKKCGGLFGGDLIVVAARPGMGKTSFVTSLACNICRPHYVENQLEPASAVAFFSLEMPREQVAIRIVCHEAELEFQKIRRGAMSREEWTRLIAGAQDLQETPIFIDDTAAIDVATVRDRVRQLKREIESGNAPGKPQKLGLVAVDYIQLMRGLKGETREREVASITQGLKQLAKEEDVPVIAVSQLNRGVEKEKDRRPALKDLRESGAIEQDADSVIFIYRDEYYDRDVPMKGIAEIDLAKQRNGPTGIVKLLFVGQTMRFYNLASTEDDYGEWEEGHT